MAYVLAEVGFQLLLHILHFKVALPYRQRRRKYGVPPLCMHGGEFAELFKRFVRHGKVNAVQAVLAVLVYAVEAFRAVCVE